MDVAQRSVPREGETDNGDAAFVYQSAELVFLAVFDGLGHGAGAAEASGKALARLEQADLTDDLETLIAQVGAALVGTRGAAGTLCRLRDDRLEGCGVGNVELRVQNSELAPILTPGVLGTPLRRCRVFGGALNGNERVFLFSDGLALPLAFGEVRDLPARDACKHLLRLHRKREDDATILIADVGE